MARTRIAVLGGARSALLRQGSRKTTMVDIAATSGVAKATLYNHFRTKSDVFAALAEHEVAQAGADAVELAATAGVQTALVRLAERVGEHPVVRRLAAQEPGVLAGVVLPEHAGAGAAAWETARRCLRQLIAAPVDVELVLRYLLSQLLWPASRTELDEVIPRLLAGGSATGRAAAAPEAAARPPEPASQRRVPSHHAGASGPTTVPGLGFPVAALVAGLADST